MDLQLEWTLPEGISSDEVDYYNVYKFPINPEGYYDIYPYLPFYEKGEQRDSTRYQVQDSFWVDDGYYYYYAMEPYAQVDGGLSSFNDPTFFEDDRYVVTFVDTSGIESHQSYLVSAKIVEPQSKDILILTWSNPILQYVVYDTIVNFYDSILTGFDYDIYNIFDSTGNDPDLFDWHIMTPYKLVIIDDGLVNLFPINDIKIQEGFEN